MSETIGPISRTIQRGNGDPLRITLAESGLDLWLVLPPDVNGWQWRFPLSVQMWESGQIQQAIAEVLAEARERARIENRAQELIDPIDGPGGEA